jgi:hypothetical protein
MIETNHFEGGSNLTLGAKKGTKGTLADILRRSQCGRVAVNITGATGEATVAFDNAFVGTDYTVNSLSWEDGGSGANDVVFRVKDGTIATTGFTVELAGTANIIGNLHWSVEYDEPA